MIRRWLARLIAWLDSEAQHPYERIGYTPTQDDEG